MEIDSLIKGVSLGQAVISSLKQILDMVPKNPQKNEVLKQITEAERSL